MTPQQRVRQALAEHGCERIPAEIDCLFRILYVTLGRALAKDGHKWNDEIVANLLIERLRKMNV